MKSKLLMFVLFVMFLLKNGLSQDKPKIFVWNFVSENIPNKDLAVQLTEDFETKLVALAKYNVLQRRNFATLLKLSSTEGDIQDLKDLSPGAKQLLATQRAEIVVWGKLSASSSGQYKITVQFQNLATSEIEKSNVQYFPASDIIDDNNRLTLIGIFVCTLVNVKPCDAGQEPQIDKEFSLIDINMNKDQTRKGIRLPSSFTIEWDEGPNNKVFQIYQNGNAVFQENVINRQIINVNSNIRGRCQFKTWWDDGSMRREELWVELTNTPTILIIKATEKIEAEKCFANYGVQINSGDVSHIDGGDWLEYKSIDFGKVKLNTFVANVCKGNATQGEIEIRVDNEKSGTLIGTLTTKQTCTDWGTWVQQSTKVSDITGIHNVYLIFNGGTGVCNLDWFKFQ